MIFIPKLRSGLKSLTGGVDGVVGAVNMLVWMVDRYISVSEMCSK